MPRKAYLFERQNGRCPVQEYLESIVDDREYARVIAVIDKIIETDGLIPKEFTKKLTGTSFWEIRTRPGNRVFYITTSRNTIVMLDGYTKKSDRIESRVLKKLNGLYDEYLMTKRVREYIK